VLPVSPGVLKPTTKPPFAPGVKPVDAKYTDKLAAALETELMLLVFMQPGPLGNPLQLGELLPPLEVVIEKLSKWLPGPIVIAPGAVRAFITFPAQSAPTQVWAPVSVIVK